MKELCAARMRPAVDKLVAEANECAAAAKTLESDVGQQSSKLAHSETRDVQHEGLLAAVDMFSRSAAGLPSLQHATAQSRLLSSWTNVMSTYFTDAKGPSVGLTLQSEGFAILEQYSKALGVALDEAAAARLRAINAVESFSRVLAKDSVTQQGRIAASLLAAQSASASLNSQLTQSTSTLSALRAEMSLVQVCPVHANPR